MTRTPFSRRAVLGLLAAPALLPGRGEAQTLPEMTSIPDALKGSGELRIVGEPQNIERRRIR